MKDEIITKVEVRFSWRDRLRVLLGRTLWVRVFTKTENVVGEVDSFSIAAVDPLWKPKPAGGEIHISAKGSGFVVCLEPGVWLAEWEGDPGRTLVQQSAKRFSSRKDAEHALRGAREYRSFQNATVAAELTHRKEGGRDENL